MLIRFSLISGATKKPKHNYLSHKEEAKFEQDGKELRWFTPDCPTTQNLPKKLATLFHQADHRSQAAHWELCQVQHHRRQAVCWEIRRDCLRAKGKNDLLVLEPLWQILQQGQGRQLLPLSSSAASTNSWELVMWEEISSKYIKKILVLSGLRNKRDVQEVK